MKVYTSGIGTLADPDEVMRDMQMEREERAHQQEADELERTCQRMEARAMMWKYRLPLTENI